MNWNDAEFGGSIHIFLKVIDKGYFSGGELTFFHYYSEDCWIRLSDSHEI